MTGKQPDALFLGGPRDGDVFVASGAPQITVPEDGGLHRYVCTDATQERAGRTLTVYSYDGLSARPHHPGL
jgi:hypothetical protein